jgi:hypothetical protein
MEIGIWDVFVMTELLQKLSKVVTRDLECTIYHGRLLQSFQKQEWGYLRCHMQPPEYFEECAAFLRHFF